MVAYHTYLRRAFERELFPSAALWLMATDATAVWLRGVAKTLSREVGDREAARELLTQAAAPAFERRYEVLAGEHPWLPSASARPRAVGMFMGSFYRSPSFRRIAWVLDGVGGRASSPREHLRAWRWVGKLSFEQRWYEAATHLGELLIVLTEELPKLGFARTHAVLGKLCFEAGSRYANDMKRALRLPDSPASAIEVLRMGEYIFRVNPEHVEGADEVAKTGYIEGNACPWYTRPGWGGAHCGIFGQFQNGISQAFGLRYRLTRTIPRHGGDVCRIDLTPIRIRATKSASVTP